MCKTRDVADADFQLNTPYNFRATRYCVSLLTGTIYGSTLSIPEHFLKTSFVRRQDNKTPGARLKVEVTERLSLSTGNIPPEWMEVLEVAVTFPQDGSSRSRGSNQPIGAPDGRFKRTRCRIFCPPWHRVPRGRFSIGPTNHGPTGPRSTDSPSTKPRR